MKKLIPAIGMTLLGAALLGTSTYAWFSANKTVTATGMNLSAKADSSLLISNAVGGTYSNTMLLENDVSGADNYMDPVQATFASEAYTFKHLTEAGKAFVKDDGTFDATAAGSAIDSFLEATTSEHYHDDMFIKYEAPVATDSPAPTQEIEFSAIMKSESTEGIYKAYRVAIVADGAVVGDVLKFTDLYKAGSTEVPEVGRVSGTAKITLTANTPKKVEVYAWLEGADSACKNSNAIKGDAFTVDLTFQIPAA